MRKITIWAAFIVICGSIGLAQGRGQGGEGRAVILEQAPKDHSIAIPRDKLAQYLKDMDAKKLQTLRMIEGGKYNVNIRRITAAETGLVHPITADLWVVLEGGGTLTTGGVLENGKINGGQTQQIKAGDVVYIPSGLPHGVSGVNTNITWLNVRWDTDWPTDAPMGAGNLNGLLGRAGGARAGGAPREGSVEARAARAGAAGASAAPPAAPGRGAAARQSAGAALQLRRQWRAVLLEGAARSDHGGHAAEEICQHEAHRGRTLQREPAVERHADGGTSRTDYRHVVPAGGRCHGEHGVSSEGRRARAQHGRVGREQTGRCVLPPVELLPRLQSRSRPTSSG